MPKGGRRSTTWEPTWKSGKTKVIRVPEALAEKLLEAAQVLDEGGEIDCHVTGNKDLDFISRDITSLKEAADTYLLTIRPKERQSAKRLLYGFLKSVGGDEIAL